MPTFIQQPSIVQAAGNKPKIIEEYIGRGNSSTESVSVARMKSPSGWIEPGQTPAFDEYTVVLRGTLRVTTKDGSQDVHAGEAVITVGLEDVIGGKKASYELPVVIHPPRSIRAPGS